MDTSRLLSFSRTSAWILLAILGAINVVAYRCSIGRTYREKASCMFWTHESFNN